LTLYTTFIIRGGSGNFHLGRPVKGQASFSVGQQDWCTWGSWGWPAPFG